MLPVEMHPGSCSCPALRNSCLFFVLIINQQKFHVCVENNLTWIKNLKDYNCGDSSAQTCFSVSLLLCRESRI